MTTDEILREIPGASDVFDLFGRWPKFHDAEIVSIKLDRAVNSELVLHAFDTTGTLNSTGHYDTIKHTLVTFVMEGVTDTEILGFNLQNVVSGLSFQRSKDEWTKEDIYRIVLGGTWGATGWIDARRLKITLKPGIPPGSVYLKTTQGGAS